MTDMAQGESVATEQHDRLGDPGVGVSIKINVFHDHVNDFHHIINYTAVATHLRLQNIPQDELQKLEAALWDFLRVVHEVLR